MLKAKQGDEVELFSHQYVREAVIQLFDFFKYEELHLFEQLISVFGIGPKTAMAVFVEAKLEDIIFAIMHGDFFLIVGMRRTNGYLEGEDLAIDNACPRGILMVDI